MTRKPKILDPNESYSFSRYAELPYERDDILADLGCTISTQQIVLPQYTGALQLQELGDRLTDAFQFTTISSEQARREFLIAPILYGAVTTGQIWQFGTFHRTNQHLIEDPSLYRIPNELEPLIRVLIGIISEQPTAALVSASQT
jgi:hypothetical protein